MLKHLSATVAAIALVSGFPTSAAAQDGEFEVAVFVSRGKGAPNLTNDVRRFVQRPLKKEGVRALSTGAINRAARVAKVKRRDLKAGEGWRDVAMVTDATHALGIHAEKGDEGIINLSYKVVDLVLAEIVLERSMALKKRRLSRTEGATLLAEIGAAIRGEEVPPAAQDEEAEDAGGGAVVASAAAAGEGGTTGAGDTVVANPDTTGTAEASAVAPTDAEDAGTGVASDGAADTTTNPDATAADLSPAEDDGVPAGATEADAMESADADGPTRSADVDGAPAEHQATPVATVTGTAEEDGLRYRDVFGYSALGAGGVTAIVGLTLVFTRDDGTQKVDPQTGNLTITTAESRGPGLGLIVGGAAISALGAYWLWLDPSLDSWLDGDDGTSVSLMPTGEGLNFGFSTRF